MAGSFNRRDFIKSTSLAGLSVAVAGPETALLASGDRYTIGNRFFTASFDRAAGTFDVRRSDGRPLLAGATSSINLDPDGPDPASAGARRRLSDGGFRFEAGAAEFEDRLGRGTRLVVHCRDATEAMDAEAHLSLYEDMPAFAFELTCRNVSAREIAIHSLEPVRAAAGEGGVLRMPGVSKCLTNGEMYYDAGMVHALGGGDGAIASGNVKGVRLANGPFPGDAATIHSWWNAGLFAGHGREGIALGYLGNDRSLGNLLLSRPADGEISIVAESVYAPRLVLPPGGSIGSNRFMVGIADDACAALEQYAAATGKSGEARTGSVLNGWCSWFYTLARVSEDEVVSNAAFAATHLKPYGLEYIQVDEGFQRWHGDWEGNERFPHGMAWLADRIRSLGFKAGLWISPYVVSEPTRLFREHPEWLVHRRDGSLQRIGNWPVGAEPPADEDPKRYCLDVTHPGAAQWLHDLVDTIVHRWGYEMIKVDFVAWSILAAERFHDPAMSAASAYRKGMEVMRRAAGERCHILECGPGEITTGLVDSMRIEADVNYGFHETAWDTYFTNPSSSAAAAAKRYYFHKRTWVNDVDHLCMDLLTGAQSEAAATLIAMSGGNLFSGDRLTQLDPAKLEILKKITPSLGQAAVPLDLFDGSPGRAFALGVERKFGRWTLLAVFNPDLVEPVARRFEAARLGLDAATTYLAFDFWKQQLRGEVRGGLEVAVQPGGVTLLALHARSGTPQFLSTDRHVSQGGLEIEDVAWDGAARALAGTSLGPPGSAHQVFVYLPDPIDWSWDGSALFRDHDGFSLKLVDRHLVRVHVRFGAIGRVRWTVRPGDFQA
jgi:hypothetical protein